MGGTERAHPLRLAVLLSGGGRSLRNLLDRIAAGTLPAEVVVVVSSRPDVNGIDIARSAGVPTFVIPRKDHADHVSFSAAVNEVLEPLHPELIVLAGFLSLYFPPPELEQCVMNIHPALLPSFGGKGFYGHRVHETVLGSGVKVSGCTVHFADPEYDAGPIIVQRAVPVLDDDDADTLAARVFEQECEAYPEAIHLFAEGRLRIEGHRVRILPPCGP
jgi:formyltetrahydrofolate-dependent phosphoribosylglycinamide formyltransferase